jgi:hypothetical protein
VPCARLCPLVHSPSAVSAHSRILLVSLFSSCTRAITTLACWLPLPPFPFTTTFNPHAYTWALDFASLAILPPLLALPSFVFEHILITRPEAPQPRGRPRSQIGASKASSKIHVPNSCRVCVTEAPRGHRFTDLPSLELCLSLAGPVAVHPQNTISVTRTESLPPKGAGLLTSRLGLTKLWLPQVRFMNVGNP